MNKNTRRLLVVSEMSFKVITTLIICVIIGVKLDQYFNSKPILAIVFSVFGLAYLVINIVLIRSEKRKYRKII